MLRYVFKATVVEDEGGRKEGRKEAKGIIVQSEAGATERKMSRMANGRT
jgi:hypothetical protein